MKMSAIMDAIRSSIGIFDIKLEYNAFSAYFSPILLNVHRRKIFLLPYYPHPTWIGE